MFSSRKAKNLINIIHERCFRIVRGDSARNIKNLLEKIKITIHQRNLQLPMTDVYKVINGHSPPIMGNFLDLKKIHPIEEMLKLYEIKAKNSKIWLEDNILQNTSPLDKSPRGIQTRKFFE